jgi:peptidoglycan/LPS O-acetylase OafA/YrhL
MIKKRPHLSLLSLLIISVISRIIMGQLPLDRGHEWFPLCRARARALIVAFTSNISFPIYLVHLPLLVLLNYNVILFVLTLVVISSMLYTFDNVIRQTMGTEVRSFFSRFSKPKRVPEKDKDVRARD